jgi:putative DNA primase/helicase
VQHERVGEMAARLGVAILAVTHLSKSSNGGSANRQFIGSIAYVAAARAAFIVARDPEDKNRRLLMPTKNNVGPDAGGLAFRIALTETAPGIHAPMVLWEGATTVTADVWAPAGRSRTRWRRLTSSNDTTSSSR